MTATQAERYLQSSGMSEEQIRTVKEAFAPKEAIWLPDFDNHGKAWICSECGAWVVFRHPYCAWCGGKMKRSEEEWMPLPESYKASPTGAEGSDKE